MSEKLIELIGLALVLASTFWRLFLAERIKQIADAVDQSRVEDKIDAIFWVACMHYVKEHPEVTKKMAIGTNLDADIDKFLSATKADVRKQSDTFARIANWAFIIGSILVLLPKLVSVIHGVPSSAETVNPLDFTP